MRTAGFILVALIMCLTSKGQNTDPINEVFESEPLPKVLKLLRKKYQFKIAYDEDLVKRSKVTAILQGIGIGDCMGRILKDTKLTHILVNNKVIILPKQKESSGQSKPKNYDFNLSGTIIDKSTGETLPNAVIHTYGSNKGVVSNMDGFFTLLHVPNDTSTIVVNYLGYVPSKIKLQPGQKVNNMSIELQSDTEMLEDVIVTDSYANTLEINTEPGKIAFNPKSMTSLPSLGEQDLFRAMQLIPGISGSNESSSELSIRGGRPSQNLVLLDGYTLYHLDHFFGIFSALNPDVIKDIQVYKGGFDARYGGRVSGVVDITAKTGNQKKPTVSVGANLMSLRATAEVPITKNISLLAAYRRSFTDVIQTPLYKKLFDISRENNEGNNFALDRVNDGFDPEFHFFDLNTKLTIRTGPKDVVALSFYYGEDDLFSSFQDSYSDITLGVFNESYNLSEVYEWGNVGGSIRWGRQWNDKNFSNFSFSAASFFDEIFSIADYELDSADVERSVSSNLSQFNIVDDVKLSFDHETLVNKHLTMKMGLSSILHSINYATTSNADTLDSEFTSSGVFSIYTTASLQPTSKLTTSIGGRLSHHELNKTFYAEPRLSVNYKASSKINVKGAYGIYHQFVNRLRFDDPYYGTQSFWDLSSFETSPVVRSNHLIGGFTYNKNNVTFDVEAYYKNVLNVAEFNYTYFLLQGTFEGTDPFQVGKNRIRGIDFLLRRDKGSYSGWISYSLAKSDQSFEQFEQGRFLPSLLDQRHELKIVNMWRKNKWEFSTNFIFGSGRPYQQYDVRYSLNNGIVEDLVVFRNSTIKRLPNYHRLDLSATYSFKVSTVNAKLGLSIFNAYGRKNIKNRRINVLALQNTLGTPNQPDLKYVDLNLLGFTPSLFLNVTM